MDPIKFQLNIPSEQVSLFEEALGDLTLSFWWDEEGTVEGLIEPPHEEEWRERTKILFPDGQFDFFPLEDRDWLQEDQNRLPPIEIGRFAIHYQKESSQPEDGKKHFTIDSAHAFGSGHHETTKSCVAALQELSSDSIRNGLDIGTGSGILAMVMASLWNAPIFATDNDPQAVLIAQKNMESNHIHNVSIFECDGIDHPQIKKESPIDLIVANLHSDPLCRLAGAIDQTLANPGFLILSGILSDQEEQVLNAYSEFLVINRIQEEDWVTLVLKKEA